MISGDSLMAFPTPSFYEGMSTVKRLYPVLTGALSLGGHSCSD